MKTFTFKIINICGVEKMTITDEKNLGLICNAPLMLDKLRSEKGIVVEWDEERVLNESQSS